MGLAQLVDFTYGFSPPSSFIKELKTLGSSEVDSKYRQFSQLKMLPFNRMAHPFVVSNQRLFNIATFISQPIWLLLTLFPRWSITKKICLQPWPIYFYALAYSAILVYTMINSQLSCVRALGVAAHVISWDLLVARFIWLDGLRKGVFTAHSLLLTNLYGPPGLLCHFLTCKVIGKDFSFFDFGSNWEMQEASAPIMPPPNSNNELNLNLSRLSKIESENTVLNIEKERLVVSVLLYFYDKELHNDAMN